MSAAPTAETRVRFVLEYRGERTSWRENSKHDTLAEAQFYRSNWEETNRRDVYAPVQLRIVKETSVITREVMP